MKPTTYRAAVQRSMPDMVSSWRCILALAGGGLFRPLALIKKRKKYKEKKMPKSLLGKYASGLLILFLLCLITLFIGLRNGMIPRGSIQAMIIGISMLITGLATFITGLISLIKYKDRSPAIILTIIFGIIAVLIIIMVVSEMLGL